MLVYFPFKSFRKETNLHKFSKGNIKIWRIKINKMEKGQNFSILFRPIIGFGNNLLWCFSGYNNLSASFPSQTKVPETLNSNAHP